MNPFSFSSPSSVDEAVRAASVSGSALAYVPGAGAAYIAGGTNIVDLMKERISKPLHLVDINRVPLADITATDDGGLMLGALARNADTADHALVRDSYPLLRAAILAGASPQIRNMATNGGNLLQRTRCYYFYDVGVPCNKREPGTGCPAIAGLSRQHAIFGGSGQCIATHPSDMCVALAALDARVHVQSESGSRVIEFADFHRLPGERPDIDTTLEPGELITAIELPPSRFGQHCTYLKIRERSSYAFALVSVAAALEFAEDGSISAARIALGGVAHKPWRNALAEQLLVGKQSTTEAFKQVAELILADAKAVGTDESPGPSRTNAYKIPLARRAIVRALEMAQAGELTNTGEDAARKRGRT